MIALVLLDPKLETKEYFIRKFMSILGQLSTLSGPGVYIEQRGVFWFFFCPIYDVEIPNIERDDIFKAIT
jgi:hypothetical protein